MSGPELVLETVIHKNVGIAEAAALQESVVESVGLAGLMRACNLSENTCRRALRRLVELGIIRQLEVVNTKAVKGTTYQIETGVKSEPVSG